jgi:hypothetical protein
MRLLKPGDGERLHWGALLLLWLGCCAGAPASAQSDEIQVYEGELAAPGQFTLALHNNFTLRGGSAADFPGGVVPEHSLNGVPEWAYGVTRWFEAGIYLPVYTRTADGALLFDSAKLRALFMTPGAADRRWFYGVNFELSYNAPHWNSHRYSAEIRPIVGVHLGQFTLVANPIIDSDFDGLDSLQFVPAVRLAYALDTHWTAALEDYADLGSLSHLQGNPHSSHTAFAVVDYSRGRGSLEFGIGRGFKNASDDLVVKLILNHDL